MIRYRLSCEQGHDFEAWFRGSEAFDRQQKRGQVSCPHCSSTKVVKAPMAPAIASGGRSVSGSTDAGEAEAIAEQIFQAMGRMRQHVEENFDYVGENFADEARAIHDGEAEERDIWGEATPKEAEDLTEDGIDVMPLPSKSKLSN